MVLAGNGTLHPAQDDAAIAHARPRTVLLNARLCALARHADDVTCLASPVTGGAVQVAWIDQLFLLARCGFDTFALRDDQDAAAALAAFRDFSVRYQAAADEPLPLFRRRAAAAA